MAKSTPGHQDLEGSPCSQNSWVQFLTLIITISEPQFPQPAKRLMLIKIVHSHLTGLAVGTGIQEIGLRALRKGCQRCLRNSDDDKIPGDLLGNDKSLSPRYLLNEIICKSHLTIAHSISSQRNSITQMDPTFKERMVSSFPLKMTPLECYY